MARKANAPVITSEEAQAALEIIRASREGREGATAKAASDALNLLGQYVRQVETLARQRAKRLGRKADPDDDLGV